LFVKKVLEMLEKMETNPIKEKAVVVLIAYSKFPFSYSTLVYKFSFLGI